MSPSSSRHKAKLEVREAAPADVDGIVALVDRAYQRISGFSRGMVRGQIDIRNLNDRRFDLYRVAWSRRPAAGRRPTPSPPTSGTDTPGGG